MKIKHFKLNTLITIMIYLLTVALFSKVCLDIRLPILRIGEAVCVFATNRNYASTIILFDESLTSLSDFATTNYYGSSNAAIIFMVVIGYSFLISLCRLLLTAFYESIVPEIKQISTKFIFLVDQTLLTEQSVQVNTAFLALP